MRLDAIAVLIGAELPQKVNGALEIGSICAADTAGSESITFLSDPKYTETIEKSEAAAVIVKKGMDIPGKICLAVEDPYYSYATLTQVFESVEPLFGRGIHASAIVHPSAKVHASAHVGPLSVIGEGCILGERVRIDAGCILEPQVTIGSDCYVHSRVMVCRNVTLGARVIIESGAVIGSEGFGNARSKGEFKRIASFGTVVIEDDAWIGANTTIDRAAFGVTRICKGVRLDNLIQIAHNVEVGEHTAIAAQTGIAGSTKVGKRVLIGGQAGFVGHITIGDDAFVGAQAGVTKSVEARSKVAGYPARDFMHMRRIEAAQEDLPEMRREFKKKRSEIDKKGLE